MACIFNPLAAELLIGGLPRPGSAGVHGLSSKKQVGSAMRVYDSARNMAEPGKNEAH